MGPHWNLPALGVIPSLQGKGYGGVMMRAVCALADSQQLPVSLECETPWHERLYGHYGFETVQMIELAVKGCLEKQIIIIMLRRPTEAT